MEKQTFRIQIRAPREVVWDVLWGNETYNAWTSVFSEGSTVQTNWDKGSKVLFLDGKGQGMVSTIDEKKVPEVMSFKHLGMIKDGVEDTTSDAVKPWAGAIEKYTLLSQNGSTELVVDMDITEEWGDYFLKVWPQALEKVKELSEARV